MKSLLLASVALCAFAVAPRAQLLVSANDNKVVLEEGRMRTLREPPPDTLSVIDIGVSPPALRSEISVPASVVGPPTTVAITPDEKLAIVTANQRPDPADPTKLIPGNSLKVIDLSVTPPRVVATLPTGAGPAGVSINRAGTLALVANRAEGSISVYRIVNNTMSNIGKVDVGTVGSELSSVSFTPDGRRALVTRQGDHLVNVLAIDGERVTKLDREITPGVRPYGLAVTPDGRYALVANLGRNTGDADTVSLIDLQREPFRVVDTVSVGQSPEGIAVSPDSRFAAVTVMNGSNQPSTSPFHGRGLVKMLRIDNGTLRVVAEAPTGTWSQGAAFSPDGKQLFVGNMVQKNINQYAVGEDGRLTEAGPPIAVNGGSAALRVAERPR